MSPFRKWLRKHDLVLLFISAHVIFLGMYFILPVIQAGVSVPIFDLMMFKGYDVEHAETFLSEISSQGRWLYVYVLMPLDFIYPFLLSSFFYQLILRQTRNRNIAVLGYLTMLFDYVENVLIIVMLITLKATHGVVISASFATNIKGFLYLFGYSYTVYLLIRYAMHRK